MEEYLAKFKSTLMDRLATAIENDLQNDPDCVKGRKKTVQVGVVRDPVASFLDTNSINPTDSLPPPPGDFPRALHALDVPAGAPAHG